MKVSPCCTEEKHSSVGSGGCPWPGTVKGAGVVGRRALDVPWRSRGAFRTTSAFKHTRHTLVLPRPAFFWGYFLQDDLFCLQLDKDNSVVEVPSVRAVTGVVSAVHLFHHDRDSVSQKRRLQLHTWNTATGQQTCQFCGPKMFQWKQHQFYYRLFSKTQPGFGHRFDRRVERGLLLWLSEAPSGPQLRITRAN